MIQQVFFKFIYVEVYLMFPEIIKMTKGGLYYRSLKEFYNYDLLFLLYSMIFKLEKRYFIIFNFHIKNSLCIYALRFLK